jgi:glycolate oxidase iron-sulfur subunit
VAAFDSHRPPEPSVIDRCVHCGFCLDACPTYVLWANEADSPRGRIVLAGQGLAEDSVLSEEMVTHFDRCLGCMACVTACPSGVQYDQLIERVRPQIERNHRRSPGDRAFRRLLFETLPHPRRQRLLAPHLGAARTAERLPGAPGRMIRLAPRPPSRRTRRRALPARTLPASGARGRVALLLGCVQRVFYPDVHRATIQTLAAEGYEVLAPALPDCCGALELHSGREEAAVARARTTIRAFAELGVDHVLTSAAGCGSAMKDYGSLLDTDQAREFSAKVKDVLELLGSVEQRAPRGPVALRVAYHDACHLAHAQGIRSEPRALLGMIPGLELLEVAVEREICCGSAGLYNLLEPQAAADLGERKARHLIETGAEAIAAANPGCSAQLDAHLQALGRPLPIYHPIELVWRSIQAASA